MPMEEALETRLKAVSALSALDVTIAWGDRPRAARRAIVMKRATPGQEWRLTEIDPTETPRIQFDCWAPDKTTAKAIGRALLAELQRTDEVVTGDTRFMPPAMIESEFEGFEALSGTDGLYRWMLDLSFFHQPA